MRIFLLNILVFGSLMFFGIVLGYRHRREIDRKVECTTYIQGKYLENNCWKGDTIVQLYIR